MQKIWEDKELGKVILKKHRNSKRYTIRIRSDVVSVTLPVWGSYKEAIQFVQQHKQTLFSKLKTTQPKPVISEQEIRELRMKALEFLPGRLHVLASLHGFSYSSVKISKSKSRWGSCSSKKNISLSLYLMALPLYLIDYVVLHELCHTIEMNHGIKFWELLDKVCNGKAKTLRKELKTYHP
ncbi:MAG: M48 family metallopeptidase [Candidatus Azobacteroides sp.]|nr:M48 family metallopeptidase [Candidatus Azobacteroides sp.]